MDVWWQVHGDNSRLRGEGEGECDLGRQYSSPLRTELAATLHSISAEVNARSCSSVPCRHHPGRCCVCSPSSRGCTPLFLKAVPQQMGTKFWAMAPLRIRRLMVASSAGQREEKGRQQQGGQGARLRAWSAGHAGHAGTAAAAGCQGHACSMHWQYPFHAGADKLEQQQQQHGRAPGTRQAPTGHLALEVGGQHVVVQLHHLVDQLLPAAERGSDGSVIEHMKRDHHSIPPANLLRFL